MKRVIKIVLKTLSYILFSLIIILAVFSVVITISSKKDSDKTANLFGYQLRFVESSSMEKCELTDVSNYKIKDIKVKSCVFIETVPENDNQALDWYSNLKVGDVLTFKYVYTKQETITHRIISIEKNSSNGYTIKLMGDNKTENSNLSIQTIDTSDTDSKNYVIGKVVKVSYPLGLLIYTLKSKVGIICVLIIPSLLIIIWEVIRIVRAFIEDKNEKNKKESDLKDLEIERLKRELEEKNRESENK